MKKYLSILFLIAFIIPSVAFASWWNPFSWFGGWTFHKTEVAPPIQVINTEKEKTPEEKISELQKQLDDLKNKKSNSDSTTTGTSAVSNTQKKSTTKEVNTPVVSPVVITPISPQPTAVSEPPKQHENYDQELSQWIAEIRERITIFNGAIKGAEDFIPVVRDTMKKYAEDSSMQSSGQDLINENNNIALISKKLVDIETQWINKLSSYLGLGILPSVDDFSSLKRDYNNYYNQYETSNAKIKLLIQTFVANEKSVLQSKITQAKQALEELKNLLSKEMTAKESKLRELKTQIDELKSAYENGGKELSMQAVLGMRAEILRKLNPLIDEYNTLLGNSSGKIYSPTQQTYFTFQADQYGGGVLRDQNSNSFYTFNCDQWGNCSIYGQ